MSLAQQVYEGLLKSGHLLTTAESCTGGMVAASITDISGSSAVFDRGFVTYSNTSKAEMLGVPQNLIQAHGAVSEVIAREMALGALKNSRATVAVAITGIAGPAGGTETKPVGLVHFYCATTKKYEKSERKIFSGNRSEIRLLAREHALRMVFQAINGG